MTLDRRDLGRSSGPRKVSKRFDAVPLEAAEPFADTTARSPDLASYRGDRLPRRGEKNHAGAPMEAGLAALPADYLAESVLLLPGERDVHTVSIGKNGT